MKTLINEDRDFGCSTKTPVGVKIILAQKGYDYKVLYILDLKAHLILMVREPLQSTVI